MNDTLPGQDDVERRERNLEGEAFPGIDSILIPNIINELYVSFRPPRVYFEDFLRGYTKAIPLTYQFKASTFGFDQAAQTAFEALPAAETAMTNTVNAFNTA